jgi:hypothetical protein
VFVKPAHPASSVTSTRRGWLSTANIILPPTMRITGAMVVDIMVIDALAEVLPPKRELAVTERVTVTSESPLKREESGASWANPEEMSKENRLMGIGAPPIVAVQANVGGVGPACKVEACRLSKGVALHTLSIDGAWIETANGVIVAGRVTFVDGMVKLNVARWRANTPPCTESKEPGRAVTCVPSLIKSSRADRHVHVLLFNIDALADSNMEATAVGRGATG